MNQERDRRINYKYWLMSSSRECLLIATRSAYARGWSSPVNLVIYRRKVWRRITRNRQLP